MFLYILFAIFIALYLQKYQPLKVRSLMVGSFYLLFCQKSLAVLLISSEL